MEQWVAAAVVLSGMGLAWYGAMRWNITLERRRKARRG